jgi:PAS domain S-box-containing protein
MGGTGFSTQVSELQRRLRELRVNDEPVAIELLLQDLQTAVEELRVADEEVRIQQAEVERLLADQQLMRWRYDRMMSALPVPTITSDVNGRVRSVNAAAAGMMGIPLSSLLSKPVFALVENDDRSPLRHALAKVVQGHGAQIGRVRLHLRGRPAELSVSLSMTPQTPDDVTWMFLTTSEDVGGDQAAVQGTLPKALLDLFSLAEGSQRQEVLQRAAYLVADALGQGVAVSLVLGSPVSPSALASSSAGAQSLDAWQLRAGQGPSFLAHASQRVVVTSDLRGDDRWTLPACADDHPEPVAVVATPLPRGQDIAGVLTVYLPPGRSVTVRSVEQIEIFAASIGSLLQELGLRTHLETLSTDMQNALASRSVIEQAKGIVMAAKHCTADEAFQHLVALSNTSHLKLRDVARQVVHASGG